MRLFCQCGLVATRYAIVTVGVSRTVLYMCDQCGEIESQYGTEIHRLYRGRDKHSRLQISEVIARLLSVRPMTVIGLSWELEKHPHYIRRILSESDLFTVVSTNTWDAEVWGIAGR